jgi:mutator protein MutT
MLIECEAFLGGSKLLPPEKLKFRPAAYGIIVNNGKILLLTNRRTGKLALPGGGSEPGERLEQALQREVREETGIEIQVEECLLWRERFFYYDPLDLAFHSFTFFFWCKPLILEPIADDQVDDEESEKPRWLAIDSLHADQFQFLGVEILALLK